MEGENGLKKHKDKMKHNEDGGSTSAELMEQVGVTSTGASESENVEKDGTSPQLLVQNKNKKKRKCKAVEEKNGAEAMGSDKLGVVEKDLQLNTLQTENVKKKKKKQKIGETTDQNSYGRSDKEGASDKEEVGDAKTSNRNTAKSERNKKSANLKQDPRIDNSNKSKSKKTSRKVSFADEVHVFPSSKRSRKDGNKEGGLVQGKRFTREEDELIKEAVHEYIETHQLGGQGLDMLLHSSKYPQLRGCWKEIGECIPYRPFSSVYIRAHVLFERSEQRGLTSDEIEVVRRHHEQHGPKWKDIADILGKHRFHVKDAWRRTRLTKAKKGHWSQDEYQSLFDLVNLDLRLKAFEEKNTKHGMIRDNIAWEAISLKLETRLFSECCLKWYRQLTSSLVSQGVWADTDDYRLIDALQNVDACCAEDVNWDDLLEHRSGEVCKKRWNQMVKHIGGYREKPFIEQVEVLSKRFCPELLEYRQ